MQREFLEKLKTNYKPVILQKNTLAYNKFILIYTRNAVCKTIFYQTGLIYSHIKLNNRQEITYPSYLFIAKK